MEYWIAYCKGYAFINKIAWRTYRRSSDVNKALSWSPSPAQAFIMSDVVCGNLIFQVQVNKSKYLRKCIHLTQVYKGCADDSTIRCGIVAGRLHGLCWNTWELSHRWHRGVHRQRKAILERGTSHADIATHQQTGLEEPESCSGLRDWVSCKAMKNPNAEEKGTKAALRFRIGGKEQNTDANGPRAGSPHRIWGGDWPNNRDN